MTRLLLIFLILSAPFPTAFAQETTETSTCPVDQTNMFDEENNLFEIEVDGETREYLLFIPEDYDPEQAMPLVIVFSGETQTANDIALMSEWHFLGEEEGFITAYLETLDDWWNDGVVTIPEKLEVNDVAFTQALIEDVVQKWCVDRNRIFASGAS